ncbi:MAG: UDP-N-acetylmuramoyl-L-alanyl-D-glutamate--2,6-diaminopimelate ligase [Clostridia bacterium]|nr:UDP-N-acetylmuramoyl-L-alanyl-D-glutamate--2,6-diaminopimelate ligase [Clostridia bacterium]
MRLSELCRDLKDAVFTGYDPEITGLAFDSRKVKPGDLFCCLSGTKLDGHLYAGQAAEKGAVALLCERDTGTGLPMAMVENARAAFAKVCAAFYGHPSDELTIFGITGTNGKTTTSTMLHTVLTAQGIKCGLIGTVGIKCGTEDWGESMTTPEPMQLQSLLRRMVDQGCTHVSMEVSSHALSQHRVEGVLFEVGIFSNLTQDHLDYHGSMEQYALEKKKLFGQCKIGVVNIDDAYAKYMQQGSTCPFVSYGTDPKAQIRAENVKLHQESVEYDLCTADESRHITVPIPGGFTVYNSLACAAACLAAGMEAERICKGLMQVKTVPGRIEVVPTGEKKYTVLLDYAHTPDSIENILHSVRGFAQKRILIVFGCGGDRDPGKRPKMGFAAGCNADYCIVTSDNPRTEDPMRIIEEIIPGVEQSNCPFEVIEDRRKAIKRALMMADEGDVIVLAGKGHEPYQEINGIRYPFDEKAIVAQILQEIAQQTEV